MASYWAAGGSVIGRRGALADNEAARLLGFYRAEAASGADAVARRFCAALAGELARSIGEAARWRQCAGEACRSSRGG
jgi:hypothetical protein